ncbi:MAG: hypothetical protein J0M36_06595 [Caulobacterales bacterium]|nr:hypothetical protein [Caulobacterales bacterium]
MNDPNDDDVHDPHGAPVDPFPTAFPPPPVSLFPPILGMETEGRRTISDSIPSSSGDPPSDWDQGADAHDLLPVGDPGPGHALVVLGRFAFPPGPPLDDDGQGARDRRWTSRIIVFATLFLLIFNAVSIQNWSRQQPPGWGTETVRRLSDVWAEQIAQTGADRPRQMVHDAWRDWRDMRFPGAETPAS